MITDNERPVILGLDQAKTSGWSIWQPGVGIEASMAGTTRTALERRNVVERATALARRSKRKLLVVFEDHAEIPASRGWGTAMLLGLGASAGRWREHLEIAGHSDAWIMKVGANEWRKKLLGSSYASNSIKRLAVARAARVLGRSVLPHEHDLAEAVCIAEWASLDGLARFFGKREMRRVRDHAKRAAQPKPAAACVLCGKPVDVTGESGDLVEVACSRGRMLWHGECADADADVRLLPWNQKVVIVKERGPGRLVGA